MNKMLSDDQNSNPKKNRVWPIDSSSEEDGTMSISIEDGNKVAQAPQAAQAEVAGQPDKAGGWQRKE